jgi:ATP-dependent Zn protease
MRPHLGTWLVGLRRAGCPAFSNTMCSGNTLYERGVVRERNKELAAYHEAGHAVVAHALGVEVEGVSIVQYEGSMGHTTTPLPENADSSDEEASADLEKHLITGVAGAASEELLTEELSELPGKDMAGVAKLLIGLEYTGAPVQADSEEALDKAKSILHDNWGSVRALAEALLKHEELGREGVLAVLENTGR